MPEGHQLPVARHERAATDFAAAHPEFQQQIPPPSFDESQLDRMPTHWPGAWLKRQY